MTWFRCIGRRCAMELLRVLTILTDAVPAKYRFGHWNRLLQVLAIRTPLPVVSSATIASDVPGNNHTWEVAGNTAATCLLAAGHLDTGGIEAVVAALARGLPAHGMRTEVVCTLGGRVEASLRRDGIPVSIVPSSELRDYVTQRRPDVIQLHRLDPDQMEALQTWSVKTVPVFHNVEPYLGRKTWSRLSQFLIDAPVCVAVSSAVRDYFHTKTGRLATVVDNGVPPGSPVSIEQRAQARSCIGTAIHTPIADDDILVVSLQRFSPQKNAAGLVSAFLDAAETNRRVRLVIAGAVNSWLELRLADAVRRGHPHGDRVHFLGDSDASTILTAADIFALNSFFEGGPIVAVEALAHGLPMVLSDVGFTREVVAACGPNGFLISRANAGYSEREVAAARRRFRQANREEFASGLRAATERVSLGSHPTLPVQFTEAGMIERHAQALWTAVTSTRERNIT